MNRTILILRVISTCHAMKGVACNSCDEDHYRDSNGLCIQCKDYIWAVYVVGFAIFLALVPILLQLSRSKGFMSVNIFIGIMQVSYIASVSLCMCGNRCISFVYRMLSVIEFWFCPL